MLRWIQASLWGLATIVGTGCATAGTRPHEMAAKQHEQAATTAEREATEHAARFDPAQARSITTRAGITEVNPTGEHRRYAAKLRSEAADHRGAARTLREAEARACSESTGGHPDLAPFFEFQEVDRVTPLYVSNGRYGALRGASITLKKADGVTAESVQSALACHLARNAALGFEAPEMGHCPLAARGVRATAREQDGRVVVDVSASSAAVAEAVLARAELLDPR